MKINGTTTTYGIIGWPVKHSLSPAFQSHFLAQQQINAVYLPFEVEPASLSQAMDGLWALHVAGFNVTVPHKESVFQMVEADADARKIGAVNTVRRGDHGWHATNTDWRGFKAVVEGLNIDITDQHVVLFGAGGTSRAILHALSCMHPARVSICNRNPERLNTLLQAVATAYPELSCEAVPWQQAAVSAACQHARLLINTTSIGLQQGQEFPFTLGGNGGAIDAVYRPDGHTAFVHAASSSGRQCSDGLPMLIAQGAAAFAWWHDCKAPACAPALARMQQILGREAHSLPGWD